MYKLIAFDMDGVIFDTRNFWIELHKAYGTLEEGKKLTEKYLATDYDRLKYEVVETLWKGKDAQPFLDLIKNIKYMRGVKETFEHIHKKGLITAIISSSAIDVARRVQNDHGVDHLYANDLIVRDGKLAGIFNSPVAAGGEHKAKILRDLCSDIGIDLAETIYVGDSNMDVAPAKIAGMAIAFNSKNDELRTAATHIVDGKDLSKIIPLI
ncbi:MAG: HAD family phosphatase [Nanoarchaeota archaeon]|nr:HAD family phosphatase [Nanoarchaeota archaeon]